jgi:hypothetical protein
MAKTQRGKKINQVKNNIAAKDFAEGKKIGRKKQIWVPVRFVEHIGQPVGGHWEKV